MDLRKTAVYTVALLFIWGVIAVMMHFIAIGANYDGWPLLLLGSCLVAGGLIVSANALTWINKIYDALAAHGQTSDAAIARLMADEHETFESLLTSDQPKQKRR